MTFSNKKQFKCPMCLQAHLMPHESFIKNEEIYTLDSFTVNQLALDFKLISNSIEEKVNRIEMRLKIRSHCKKVRNEIHLAIDEAHAKLKQRQEEFFNEIDAYEKECYKQLNLVNQIDVDKLLVKSKSILSQSKIDDEENFKQLIMKATELLDNLSNTCKQLETKMPISNVLTFEKNKNLLISTNEVGQIKMKEFQ